MPRPSHTLSSIRTPATRSGALVHRVMVGVVDRDEVSDPDIGSNLDAERRHDRRALVDERPITDDELTGLGCAQLHQEENSPKREPSQSHRPSGVNPRQPTFAADKLAAHAADPQDRRAEAALEDDPIRPVGELLQTRAEPSGGFIPAPPVRQPAER